MDDDICYWLACELADSKNRHNAHNIFKMTKRHASKNPTVLITDKLSAYQKIARKVFGNKTYHKSNAGIQSRCMGSSGKPTGPTTVPQITGWNVSMALSVTKRRPFAA